MSSLIEEQVAERLRDHAVAVAPPLGYDPDRIVALGRRRRHTAVAGAAIAGLAGSVALGLAVAEIVTPHSEVLGFASSIDEVPVGPEPVELIKRLGDEFANPEPGAAFSPDRDPFPLDIPVDVLESTARFVGGLSGEDAYVALDAEGRICLVIVYPMVESDWVADSRCVWPSVFRDDGLTIAVDEAYGPVTAWLVPDAFGQPPTGWEKVGDNLWVTTPEYPTNQAGLTYGPMVGYSGETMPDLGLVLADDGVTQGYVYRTELEGPVPSSPEEALQWQEDGRYSTQVVPVYESDGITRIGTFTVGG